jgi:hypothetical protein
VRKRYFPFVDDGKPRATRFRAFLRHRECDQSSCEAGRQENQEPGPKYTRPIAAPVSQFLCREVPSVAFTMLIAASGDTWKTP